ncbi:hypothetical protein BDW62DRAFT_135485 [Aspergillus aurantiobrunneus]
MHTKSPESLVLVSPPRIRTITISLLAVVPCECEIAGLVLLALWMEISETGYLRCRLLI